VYLPRSANNAAGSPGGADETDLFLATAQRHFDETFLPPLADVCFGGLVAGGIPRGRRIRFGRRSSSRLSASESVPGDARFASRSCSCRMNTAVARIPTATDGSPRSRRHSVSRETNSRSAISLVERRRLSRATARSRPNFCSAVRAGNGMELARDIVASVLSDVSTGNVRHTRHKVCLLAEANVVIESNRSRLHSCDE
jgi:hypothetical protein